MFEKESMKTAFQKGDADQKSLVEESRDDIKNQDIYHLDKVMTNQYVIAEKKEKEKAKPLVFNKKTILNGVIFSEILGKPKGL